MSKRDYKFPHTAERLVLCPLKIEAKALSQAFTEKGLRELPFSSGEAYFPEERLVLSWAGHSKARYAAAASRALALNPSLRTLICCGTSGSLVNEVQERDVVLGKETVECDFLAAFINPGQLPRFSSSVLAKINPLPSFGFSSFQLHIGGIASCNEDIVTRRRAEEIHLKSQCLVTAWEGAGGAYAAEANSVDYLELRAVTDHCDENLVSSFQNNLEPALSHSAEVLLKVLHLLEKAESNSK